jgi:hypothetical protein
MKITGYVKIVVKDKDGNVKFQEEGKNLVTSAGKAAVAGLVGNTGSVTAFTYLAVGTSDTAAAAGDTTLGAEITDTGLERATATVTRITTTVANDTLSLAKTWTATGAKTVKEVGAFNASSSGTLLGRRVIGPYTVANTDQLSITYTFKFA